MSGHFSGDRHSDPSNNSMNRSRGNAAPKTGLLSRTIIQSPMIQWVVPARIRHPDKNDVVFVGEGFIQIKELLSSGDHRYLEEVVTKTDFDSKIVGVKVINARPEVGLDDQVKLNAQGQDRDVPIAETSSAQNLPPHILVLVLASKDLLFTYAIESSQDSLEFVHFRRPLPADVGALEEYGRHICVDPRSRAMAISAAQKFFGVFALKQPSLLQSEMGEGRLVPIREERFFRTDGDILMMDFLHPASNDKNRAILLLLVSKNGETCIQCYDWNTTESLRLISTKSLGRKLPPDCSLPSLLIPLKKTISFLLVSTSCMLIYRDILEPDSAQRRLKCPLPSLDGSDQPGEQVWTFWARAIRNTRRSDAVFLCREDGKSLYLEFGAGGDIERQSQPGHLGCNVDTAFAIIDGGYQAGDLILAVGSMSGGGLFIADARQPPRCVQRIPNWAPVLDSVTLRATGPRGQFGHSESDQTTNVSYDRIFVCSGVGTEQGSITELRYGIEARIGLLIDHEDASSITDIWAIPDSETAGTFLLFSDPMSSSLISVPVDAEELYGVEEETSGLDLSASTLAAAATERGITLQVTNSSVNFSMIGNENLHHSSKCQNPAERILAAAANGRLSMVATAVRDEVKTRIEILRVEINENSLQSCLMGEPYELEQEPVCLALAGRHSTTLLFVGTGDGNILISGIDSAGPLVPSEHVIRLDDENGDSTICESLSLISSDSNGTSTSILLCGLRSGNLVTFRFDISAETRTPVLKKLSRHKLGDTPVRIRGYESDPSFAVASCGFGLWRLSSNADGDISQEYTMDKIWVTDQNNPARVQSSIDVFSCVEPQSSGEPGGLGGSLVCLTSNQLLACNLERIPKPVPRHIQIPGSPRRLIYSEYLKRLIVGYNITEIEVDAECRKRMVRPQIAFVDPDCESMVPPSTSDTSPRSRLPTGASGEKISALLDWQSTHNGNVYHMIVIGTIHPGGPGASQQGRLIYVTARPNPDVPGQIDSVVKFVHNYNSPVRAIAAYGPASLVVAVGDQIILQTVDKDTKKWRKSIPYKMESPAVSITTQEPYIRILTSKHSLGILRVTGNQVSLHGQAGYDRSGLDHVDFDDGSGITMTSNRGGAIVGITDVGLSPEEKLLRPVFTSHMPLSVVRLSQSFRKKALESSHIAYGATIDGSVYRFTTLDEKEWRLLRFVQNLCVSDPIICPFAKRRRTSIADIDPLSSSKPDTMHVNGDILSRLVKRGCSHLEGMVRSSSIGVRPTSNNTAVPSMSGDTGDANDNASSVKLQLFQDYSEKVAGDAENPYAAVMLWIGKLLRVEL